MKRKAIFYGTMLTVLAVLLAAVLLLTGVYGHWFSRRAAGLAAATEVTGDVSIARGGTYYALKNGIALREGDAINVEQNAAFRAEVNGLVRASADSESRLRLRELREGAVSFDVTGGAVYFDEVQSGEAGRVVVSADDVELRMTSGSIAAVETYNGTITVSVFRGAPEMRFAERTYPLMQGDRVIIVSGDDTESLMFSYLSASNMREFFIEQLIDCGGLMYDVSALEDILARRRSDAASTAVAEEPSTCTLEIRCDTVLDHMDMLSEEKAARIPADGVMLPAMSVAFTDGENVYEVLRRACLSSCIEINYNYAVTLSGYYIRELGGLSEMDCGPTSGWMYKVNGWYPNYGCAKYLVDDGDVIVWSYSCDGLGEDLGIEPWMNGRLETYMN